MHGTVFNCIIFGLVAQVVSLSFYAVQLTKRYISMADSTAHQALMSATHGVDGAGFSGQVMDIYNSLSDQQQEMMGTDEYLEFFSGIDMGESSTYKRLVNMMAGTAENADVYDVYMAMFDKEKGRIIYIIDSDPDPETVFYPGEWEEADKKQAAKFLKGTDEGPLYYIDNTQNYGMLCTVAVPITDKAGQTISFMLVDISIKDVAVGMAIFSLRLFLAMVIVTIILAFLQTKRIRKELVDPVNMIDQASRSYVKARHEGHTDIDFFSNLDIHTGDEVENLCHTMMEMEKELQDYEENLTRVTAEKERIGTELSLATRIQQSMLPHLYPAFPDRSEFDVYATMKPAREVGGDFYDYFLVDDDHLCVVVADVSGKGIPAALFMMISKTILQSCAMLGNSAADTLNRMNEAICSKNQTDMFVTVWLGILEISTGKLTCANAGHEYPALKRADGQFELLKEKHGFVVGGIEGTKYEEYEIKLNYGDKLFLYTDGLPEATNSKNKMYGKNRMLDSLNKDPDVSINELFNHVRTDINAFVQEAEQFDDLTMLCLEYKLKYKNHTV